MIFDFATANGSATAGVDPVGSAAISRLILNLKVRGKTVLITSHLLGQIEDICDRVAILDRGKLILEGAVRDLVGRADRQALIVESLPEAELGALRTWLVERGRRLEAVETPRTRLDLLFLERVGRSSGTSVPGASGNHPTKDGTAANER